MKRKLSRKIRNLIKFLLLEEYGKERIEMFLKILKKNAEKEKETIAYSDDNIRHMIQVFKYLADRGLIKDKQLINKSTPSSLEDEIEKHSYETKFKDKNFMPDFQNFGFRCSDIDKEKLSNNKDLVYSNPSKTFFILKGDSFQKCVAYGSGTDWCISKPANVSYYRRRSQHSFYFIIDCDNPNPAYARATLHIPKNPNEPILITRLDTNEDFQTNYSELIKIYPELKNFDFSKLKYENFNEGISENDINFLYAYLSNSSLREPINIFNVIKNYKREKKIKNESVIDIIQKIFSFHKAQLEWLYSIPSEELVCKIINEDHVSLNYNDYENFRKYYELKKKYQNKIKKEVFENNVKNFINFFIRNFSYDKLSQLVSETNGIYNSFIYEQFRDIPQLNIYFLKNEKLSPFLEFIEKHNLFHLFNEKEWNVYISSDNLNEIADQLNSFIHRIKKIRNFSINNSKNGKLVIDDIPIFSLIIDYDQNINVIMGKDATCDMVTIGPRCENSKITFNNDIDLLKIKDDRAKLSNPTNIIINGNVNVIEIESATLSSGKIKIHQSANSFLKILKILKWDGKKPDFSHFDALPKKIIYK